MRLKRAGEGRIMTTVGELVISITTTTITIISNVTIIIVIIT